MFPSRLAGLSYFHSVPAPLSPRPGGRPVSIPSGGIILFPPVVVFPGRDKDHRQRRVSIPSGGIILFPPLGDLETLITMASFHPVWRDYPISTLRARAGRGQPGHRSFHPVWRDYPISTLGQGGGPDPRQRDEFPSRLAGLSYFHFGPQRCFLSPVPSSFHPVWRDYPISTTTWYGLWTEQKSVSIPSGGIILFPLAASGTLRR